MHFMILYGYLISWHYMWFHDNTWIFHDISHGVLSSRHRGGSTGWINWVPHWNRLGQCGHFRTRPCGSGAVRSGVRRGLQRKVVRKGSASWGKCMKMQEMLWYVGVISKSKLLIFQNLLGLSPETVPFLEPIIAMKCVGVNRFGNLSLLWWPESYLNDGTFFWNWLNLYMWRSLHNPSLQVLSPPIVPGGLTTLLACWSKIE